VTEGTLDFYGGFHHSIAFLCDPVVITPLSYFLDHLHCRYGRRPRKPDPIRLIVPFFKVSYL
jgi:hypothetical protein